MCFCLFFTISAAYRKLDCINFPLLTFQHDTDCTHTGVMHISRSATIIKSDKLRVSSSSLMCSSWIRCLCTRLRWHSVKLPASIFIILHRFLWLFASSTRPSVVSGEKINLNPKSSCWNHNWLLQSCRLLWYASILCDGACTRCCNDPGNKWRWWCWKSFWNFWRGRTSYIFQVSESLTFENSTTYMKMIQTSPARWSERKTKFVFTFCLFYIHLLFFISAHSMDFDPFLRSTFWMVSTGLTTMWVANVGAYGKA